MATPGAESAVCDCLVVGVIINVANERDMWLYTGELRRFTAPGLWASNLLAPVTGRPDLETCATISSNSIYRFIYNIYLVHHVNSWGIFKAQGHSSKAQVENAFVGDVYLLNRTLHVDSLTSNCWLFEFFVPNW